MILSPVSWLPPGTDPNPCWKRFWTDVPHHRPDLWCASRQLPEPEHFQRGVLSKSTSDLSSSQSNLEKAREIQIFFKKWANPGLFLFIFVFPTLHNSINSWKRRWCAWDSNPGQQDGSRRRIHWAMAAPQNSNLNVSILLHNNSRPMKLFNWFPPCNIFLLLSRRHFGEKWVCTWTSCNVL